MPLYEYQCEQCGEVIDHACRISERPPFILCECDGKMTQKPCIGAVLGNEAAWLQSVTEVVNKDGGAHCQRFLKDPTRDNYHAWMQGENLRPMEPGESTWKRPPKPNRRKLVDEVMKKRQQRNAIKVA